MQLCGYAVVQFCSFAVMPLRRYAVMPLCRYAVTPLRLSMCLQPVFSRTAVDLQGDIKLCGT